MGGMFVYYSQMALLLEAIPSSFAQESELCVCHRALTRTLTEHDRGTLFEKHYGEGVRTCLMNGKVVPELVAGRLEEVVEEVYHIHERRLRSTTYRGVPAPTLAEWTAMLGDFKIGQLSILAQLRVKTDYMKRLPVNCCGLAVIDEALARRIGADIIEMFDKDPREEVHHGPKRRSPS